MESNVVLVEELKYIFLIIGTRKISFRYGRQKQTYPKFEGLKLGLNLVFLQ